MLLIHSHDILFPPSIQEPQIQLEPGSFFAPG
jgi:hypothetical protein